MKNIYITVLFILTISFNANSQTFISDSIRRYSESTNEIIEAQPDTSYTIERSYKTILVTQRIEGYVGVKSRGISEKQWRIRIDDISFSLSSIFNSFPVRKGNMKFRTIKGTLYASGLRQYVRVAYNLIDLNDDGKYEGLEYIMREGQDILLYIYCHRVKD